MTHTITETNTGIADWIEERQGRFIAMADQIWEHPEMGLAEHFACKLQSDDLALDGFTITPNVGGMPTAFVAEWSQGEGGPKIGFLGEYDALPGLSQDRTDTQQPIVPGGDGHGCGHNLLGTASLAAASVVKAWLERTGQPGTIRYYGCPAEETADGKVFMARDGVFDDLDAAFCWHPGSHTTVWQSTSLAINGMFYRFRGRTAHAAANPESGRSALDAVELMNVGVNFLREHMPEKARIHYTITNGGGAPNVVPDDCEVWYYIRSPERYQVNELTERVNRIAEGAAMMTETTCEITFISGSYNYLPNDVLGQQLMAALESLGPIEFTDDEVAFARNVADGFPREMRASILDKSHLPAELIDAGLTGEIWPPKDKGEIGAGSTDVSDVSWITPVAQITTATWALGIPGHSWAVTATGAMSIGHKGMLHAAKAMAIAAAALVEQPDLIRQAREEFVASTAGGAYQCPLPADLKPPLP